MGGSLVIHSEQTTFNLVVYLNLVKRIMVSNTSRLVIFLKKIRTKLGHVVWMSISLVRSLTSIKLKKHQKNRPGSVENSSFFRIFLN